MNQHESILRRGWRLGRQLWRQPSSRIAISVLILGCLLAQLPLAELCGTISQVSPQYWAFALAVFVLCHVLASLKWRLLANLGRREVSVFTAVRCHFAGLFANLFLPSLAGGDVVRAGLAIAATGEKEGVILGSLLDRFLDICGLVFMVTLATLLLPDALLTENWLPVAGTLGLLALCLAAATCC